MEYTIHPRETSPRRSRSHNNHHRLTDQHLVDSEAAYAAAYATRRPRTTMGDPKRYDDYVLTVIQQPERARLCSFKEENDTIDRRPVDPPPVVQVFCPGEDHARPMDATKFFIRTSIVNSQPSLNDRGEEEYLPVKTPTGSDAAAGEVIQTPERLRGINGEHGFMVIFAKLSVRMPGIFRLKFTLYHTSELGMQRLVHTVSDAFEVFSPKLFKGMRESTALTRHLASQGLKVKLRTDTTVGRQSDSRRRSGQIRTPVTSTPCSPEPPPPTGLGHAASPPPTGTNPFRAPNSQPHYNYPHHHPGNNSGGFGVGAGPSGSSSSLSTSPQHFQHQHTQLSPFGAQHDPLQPMRPPINPNTPGFRSVPAPPAASARSLVWNAPALYNRDQASSSRSSSPVVPGRFQDDGFPSFRDIGSRFDSIPTPSPSDLSAFSLSQDRHATSASSSTQSIPHNFSPFSSAPSSSSTASFSTPTSSARTDSYGMHDLPPIHGNPLNLGPGDDGIARFPFLTSTSRPGGAGPVLPPPTPSYRGPIPPAVMVQPSTVPSPLTMLPPIRDTAALPEEPQVK